MPVIPTFKEWGQEDQKHKFIPGYKRAPGHPGLDEIQSQKKITLKPKCCGCLVSSSVKVYKNYKNYMGVGGMAKSTGCSSGGLEFNSQHSDAALNCP